MAPVYMTQRCCYFCCDARCTQEDYCLGCNAFVCSACDHPNPDERPQEIAHAPEAHRQHAVKS